LFKTNIEKCPNNFISINNNCYMFGHKEQLNWNHANEKCQQFNSNLIDLNDLEEFFHIFTYLMENKLESFYDTMHLRASHNQQTKNFYESNLTTESKTNEKIFRLLENNLAKIDNNTYNNNNFNGERKFSEEQLKFFKLKLCEFKSKVSGHRADEIDLLKLNKSNNLIKDNSVFFELNSHLNNYNSSNLAEEVFTFHGSNNCITLNIQKNINENINSSNDLFSRICITINQCQKKLPFICKLNSDQFKHGQIFYKNSLSDYQQDPKMSYLMNSFLAVAHGLDSAQKNVLLFAAF
jgi:hypothetical protein